MRDFGRTGYARDAKGRFAGTAVQIARTSKAMQELSHAARRVSEIYRIRCQFAALKARVIEHYARLA